MSQLTRQLLLKVLEIVALEQWRLGDEVNSELPNEETLAYYGPKQLRDVLVVEKGTIMCKTIPLATKEASFTAF